MQPIGLSSENMKKKHEMMHTEENYMIADIVTKLFPKNPKET